MNDESIPSAIDRALARDFDRTVLQFSPRLDRWTEEGDRVALQRSEKLLDELGLQRADPKMAAMKLAAKTLSALLEWESGRVSVFPTEAVDKALFDLKKAIRDGEGS